MLSLFCLVEVIWKKYFLTIYLLLLFVFSGGLVISAQWMVAGYEILQNLLYGKTTVQIYQKQSNGLTRLSKRQESSNWKSQEPRCTIYHSINFAKHLHMQLTIIEFWFKEMSGICVMACTMQDNLKCYRYLTAS